MKRAGVIWLVLIAACAGDVPHDENLDVPALGDERGKQLEPDAAPQVELDPEPPSTPGEPSQPDALAYGTAVNGENSWLDLFDYGGEFLDGLGPGYEVYNGVVTGDTTTNRVDNHWVVEAKDVYIGGATMRPNRSFRYEDGKIVVEADVAVPFPKGSDSWAELDISTLPEPNTDGAGVYGFDRYQGGWAFGCRLESHTRHTICALKDNTTPSGRVYEVPQSAYAIPEGGNVVGGGPYPSGGERDQAWRSCEAAEIAEDFLGCRNRFRMELERDAFRVYVNDVLYIEFTGIYPERQFPDEFVNGELYVYFSSWAYQLDAQNPTVFHWDRIAVNPPF